VWSYPGSVSLAGYHSFALFDLSVCGVSLQQAAFGDSQQPVSAVVDTGSSCLSLPAELFDALVSWLPVSCSDSADGLQQGDSSAGSLGGNAFPPVAQSGQFASSPTSAANPASASNINTHVRYCWLPADLLADALPSVSFRLSASDAQLPDSDPRQPVRLILPLTDLILGQQRATFAAQTPPQRSPQADSSSALLLSSSACCLSQRCCCRCPSAVCCPAADSGSACTALAASSQQSRTGSVHAGSGCVSIRRVSPGCTAALCCCCCCYSVSPPFISIGSRSLSSLHAVFSPSSQQVGLANFASVSGSNASCVLPVSCVGQQQQDALYNVCLDPSCSSFYFFSLNAQTHSCELTAAFHVIAALLIALLIAVELGLNEWLISISRRVQGITSAQQQRPAGQRSARRQQQQQQQQLNAR
jgi:hypothetical protein